MKKTSLLEVDAFLFPGGGQESVVLQLLRLLDREKFRVSFATSDRANLPKIPPDVDVHRIGLRSKFDLTTCWRLRKLVREQRIEILHVHGFRASLLSRLAYLLPFWGIPVVYTAHVNYEQLVDFTRSPTRWLSVIIGNILDAFSTRHLVFVSHKGMNRRLDELPKLDTRKCTVIYNGVSLPEKKGFGKQRKRARKISIVCLSALVARKGVHILIEAARILRDKGVGGFEISIAGEGTERPGLERMIIDFRLGKTVFLMGYVDRKTVLRHADIFVLPTFSEGLPLSILEAGLYGLPVVASNVDGIPEAMLDEESGLLVDPGDSAGLAGAIERLIVNTALRKKFGMALRKRVVRNFSENSMIENYSALFQRIVAP